MRPSCQGFTIHAAVPYALISARSPDENARVLVRFSAPAALAAFTPAAVGWFSYTKDATPLRGVAAGGGEGEGEGGGGASVPRRAPLSWLLQPGFVLRYMEEAEAGGEALQASNAASTSTSISACASYLHTALFSPF